MDSIWGGGPKSETGKWEVILHKFPIDVEVLYFSCSTIAFLPLVYS